MELTLNHQICCDLLNMGALAENNIGGTDHICIEIYLFKVNQLSIDHFDLPVLGNSIVLRIDVHNKSIVLLSVCSQP